MKSDRIKTIQNLLESKSGIHLSFYIQNSGDDTETLEHIHNLLIEADNVLSAGVTKQEAEQLLEPIKTLLKDPRIFKSMAGNIALFRNKDSLRIMSLPIETSTQVHVASSFHVKPLLTWLQWDQEFFVLGVSSHCAQFYSVTQTLSQTVSEIDFDNEIDLPPKRAFGKHKEEFHRIRKLHFYHWFDEALNQITSPSPIRVFYIGDQKLFQSCKKRWKDQVHFIPLSIEEYVVWRQVEYIEQAREEFAKLIRTDLKLESADLLQAHRLGLAKTNLFEISKAAALKKVERLLIAEEVFIFGKMDQKTGDLRIHPYDLDHEDDDVLDDLAQQVLSSGGQVLILPLNEIPLQKPAIAILKNERHRTNGITLEQSPQDLLA